VSTSGGRGAASPKVEQAAAAITKSQEQAYRDALDDLARSPAIRQRLERNARKVRRAAPAVRAVSFNEFLAMQIAPRVKILTPWLEAQGIYMGHSPRGVGKTFMGLYIGYAVASGGSLFSWTAPEPRGVLYLDGEMPACVLQERLALIARSSDFEPRAPLRIITPDLQDMVLPDLATPEGQQAIDAHIDADIGLVILDNLSCLVRSGEENAAESWQPLQTWMLDLRKRGRSVLFFHHSGKAGLQRGTSRREDVLDAVLALKRPALYSPEDGCVFELHFEKARGLYGDALKPFEAKLEQIADGHLAWTTRTLEKRIREQVIELLDGGMKQADIARSLGINRSTVSRYAKENS
jgi:AAA domain/Homeodomain-like domain